MENSFHLLIEAVVQGKLTEIEAERLLNAITRTNTGTPTGVPRSNEPPTHNLF